MTVVCWLHCITGSRAGRGGCCRSCWATQSQLMCSLQLVKEHLRVIRQVCRRERHICDSTARSLRLINGLISKQRSVVEWRACLILEVLDEAEIAWVSDSTSGVSTSPNTATSHWIVSCEYCQSAEFESKLRPLTSWV